jgi:hypothetical protein
MTDNKKIDNNKDKKGSFDHEDFRRQIVYLHKPDINKKHIEKASQEIEKKFSTHFNSSSKGRSVKTMPEENKVNVLNTVMETAKKRIDEVSAQMATHASVKAKEKANRIVNKYNDTMIEPHNKIEGGWMVKPGKEKEASSMMNTADKKRDQANKFSLYAKIKARKEMKNEEVVDEGLGKNIIAGVTALGIGAGVGAATSKAFPDKPATYQVIGNNVVMKKNPGKIVHTAKSKEDAMKWATTQKEEVEQVDEISAKTGMSYSIKATSQVGKGNLDSSKESKRLAGVKMADDKYRKMQGKSTQAKVGFGEDKEHIDEGMPSGVVKDKARLAQMSDQEFAEKYKDLSDDRLRAKARIHAIKDQEHYVKRRKRGLSEEAEKKKITKIKLGKEKEDIGYKVVDVGPGGKETVRKQHNWKEEVEQVDEMGKKGSFRPVSPGVQNLRTAQAATRGDKALDKEYHYGTTKGGVSPIASKRREQGFGSVANYNSAHAALTAKKQGASGKGQDAAIHKGWGKTVDQMPAANPEKQAARKKLQQTSFSSLSKGEQEKDTVLRKGITSEELSIYEGWYDTKPNSDGTHTVVKINNDKNPYNHKVGDTVSKGEHTTRMYHSDGSAYSQVQKEQFGLDEGRGRPPKVGSKAWHAKQAAAKSGEGEEQEADKNIVNQMRKKPVGDSHTLTFNNGEKKQVHVQHVNKALSMLANTPKPADREKLQNSFSHSHDRFMATIKSGKPVEDAARPKVSLGKMKAESVDPSTTPAARGSITTRVIRKPDGSLVLTKTHVGRKFTRDVVDAQEAITMYNPEKEEKEEKKEKHETPKGLSVDLTSDSRKKLASDPLASKEKFDIPPTVGNKSAGGEDTTYGMGKYSVAEDETLNNLYADLSEENKQIFNNLIQTEQGIEKLLQFAANQGY